MDSNLVEIAKVIVANGVEDWCLSPTQLFVTMKDDDTQDRTFRELSEKGLLDGWNLTNGKDDLIFEGEYRTLNLLADEIDGQWGG